MSLWRDGPPAGLDESRACLHLLRFLSLSLKVTDSSLRRRDETAGHVIHTQTLKELQTHISQLRELGRSAVERLNQVRTAALATAGYHSV